MRAVGVMVHGGPDALEVVDLPEVHAGPGQVRVRIYAAAVNPTDTMARNGSRAEQQKVDPPPYGLCRKFCSGDAEGTVAPVGGVIRRPGRRTVRPE
jgi:NADPH:quinone reductase-like Zn-dependent oxidoreductase